MMTDELRAARKEEIRLARRFRDPVGFRLMFEAVFVQGIHARQLV
jgi:hypothetical protein